MTRALMIVVALVGTQGAACVVEADSFGGPCVLQEAVGAGPGVAILDPVSAECDSEVCLYYNERTFCSLPCESDEDCAGVDGGVCEFELVVGDPEDLGTYCVVPEASTRP